jgi:hypothetical protein
MLSRMNRTVSTSQALDREPSGTRREAVYARSAERPVPVVRSSGARRAMLAYLAGVGSLVAPR